MGGKVAKKLGDGLMALFGYPVPQENAVNPLARRCPRVAARRNFVPTASLASRIKLPAPADEGRHEERCLTQQIADWLEKLGVVQYEQRFAKNDTGVTGRSFHRDASR
jgi:hypothetical protein